uniref:F-box protein 43 n=1 Tax=Kryptolebias marmoratus TaxID=37003 RepID=A0A3Q2ZS09_KRYMA
MECTTKSSVHLRSYKAKPSYDGCSDSGYSGLFQSPRSIMGVDSCRSTSPAEFSETPKENLKLTATPKERARETNRLLRTDSREVPLSSAVSWCETPRVQKRNAPLRHRLVFCKPTTVSGTQSPSTTKTESTLSVRPEHWLSASFDSLDLMTVEASNTLKLDQDLSLSVRKRQLFTQVRTSTLEDGNPNICNLSSFERSVSLTETEFNDGVSDSDHLDANAPGFDKLLPGVPSESSDTNILCDGASGFCTPTLAQTPKYIRSVSEDSGFSSLTLDKSQDSSVDHDGSFQELLVSASRGNSETPNLSVTKRRSRLQRQHRLSTLKEGGSQSEENPVFADDSTPSTTSRPENSTPTCAGSFTPTITPLRTTPVNLSLTPALQLVHTMCQHKVQMFSGQSPSMKEELKTTVVLAKTPLAFRTTMPLMGLIGRKMGLGKLDVLTELKKRNLRHILAIIFSMLSSECLYRCGLVCKSWNETILQDNQANLRRKDYLSEVEACGGAVQVSDAETRVTLLKRSALKTVQAQSRTSSFLTFFQVAKTLFIDECLKPCPRCQDPARCHSVKGEGVCSRADCGFQFCTSCLCAFHGSRECGSRSGGRRKKDNLLPGSAQSKRNIRRL